VLNTRELQLSLRYEPPSPKFSRSSANMVSYRCVGGLRGLHGRVVAEVVWAQPSDALSGRAGFIQGCPETGLS